MTLLADTQQIVALSGAEWAAWGTVALFAVAMSALCSGLETGAYCLNRVRLHVRAHVPNSNASTLLSLVNRPNRLLATLLIGTNIASYVASYALTTIMEGVGMTQRQMLVFSTAILTPTLFIFGEVLPKDLYRGFSDRLTYPFARPLWFFQKMLLFTGLLPLVDGLCSWMARRLRSDEVTGLTLHPRGAMTRLIKEGIGHGVLSEYQSDIIDRVLELDRQTVVDVMVEWADVSKVRIDQPPEAIWAMADRLPYSRLPLTDTKGRPIGILDVYEVLRHDPADCPPLESLVKPIITITRKTSLRAALKKLQAERTTIALVVKKKYPEKPIGLVTVKDLVEPIVGELEIW